MTPDPSCTELLERVSEYLDQELDHDTCRAIEAHCRHCVGCAALIAGLRETIGLCRAATLRPLPESVRAKARTQIDELLGRGRTAE